MFKANLSFSQLNQYLAILSQANLLEMSAFDGRAVYKPTQKGLEFMQKQQQIISLLNVDMHRSNLKTSFFDFNDF